MARAAGPKPQASIYETTIENAELEEALEEREKLRARRSDVDALYKEADAKAKGFLASLEMADAPVRIGRFVVTRREIPAQPVSFERNASTRYQIALIEDAA